MKFKLLALDIDGTILNSASQLTPRTIAAVQKAQERGIKVCWPRVAAWQHPAPGWGPGRA